MLQAMLPQSSKKKPPPWPSPSSGAKVFLKHPSDLSRGKGIREERPEELEDAGMEDTLSESRKLTGNDFGPDREAGGGTAPSAYSFPFTKTSKKISIASNLHQYLSKEAIANRMVFLLTIGLVVIFCICVGRDGAIGGNMEWLSDSLFDVAVEAGLPGFETADLQHAQAAARSVENSIVARNPRQEPGLPIVLLIAVNQRQVAAHAVDRLLTLFSPIFRELHMNKTAIVWVWDAEKPHFLSTKDSTVYKCGGDWRVSTMASKYTSGEAVVKYMTGRLNVGVWYVDASMLATLELASADQIRGVVVPALFGNANGFNHIDMSSVTMSPLDSEGSGPDSSSERASGDELDAGDALSPPCLPLVYGSIFFAWPTTKTVQFFSDADAWTSRLRGGPGTIGGPVDSFVFNALLNDGRPLMHVAPYRPPSVQQLPPSALLLSLLSDYRRCTTMHPSAVIEDALLYATFSWSNIRSRGGGRRVWRSRRRQPVDSHGPSGVEDTPPPGPKEDNVTAAVQVAPAGYTPSCTLYRDGDDVCCP